LTAGGDANGVLNLLPGKMKRATRHDRRDESSQSRVMPTTFADARKACFAEAHLKFMAQNKAYDQFLTIAPGALTRGHCRRKNIGGVRRILLPVDVVVIHAADHQCVGQRRGDGIDLLSCANDGRRAASRDFVEDFERDLYIMLLVAAEGAANRVQQVTLGFVNGVFRDVLEPESRSPTGHPRGDGFFSRDGFFSGHGRSLAISL
jgi:hypothetical protein